MSTATLKKLTDEPIMILTVTGSIADLGDSEQERTQLISLLDAVSEPVFFILDMSNAKLNLDRLMRGSHDAYLGASPTFKHPNIREILQVSDDPGLELAASGLDSDLFGNVRIQQFKTLDAALAYARAAR